MPTNILRKANTPSGVGASGKRTDDVQNKIIVKIGRVTLNAHLLPTQTAARFWAALPLHGAVETWGEALHFALPIALGRERGARLNGVLGDIYVWAEEQRIILPFGPTPISRPDEIRLPRPCNVLAHVVGDLSEQTNDLQRIQPGTKISILRSS